MFEKFTDGVNYVATMINTELPELIEDMNDAAVDVASAKQSANEAAASANASASSATDAATSATAAKSSETTTSALATQVATDVELVETYKEAAEAAMDEAEHSAERAAASAVEAKTYREEAKTYRDEALEAEDNILEKMDEAVAATIVAATEAADRALASETSAATSVETIEALTLDVEAKVTEATGLVDDVLQGVADTQEMLEETQALLDIEATYDELGVVVLASADDVANKTGTGVVTAEALQGFVYTGSTLVAPITAGGTGADNLEDAQSNLGITDLDTRVDDLDTRVDDLEGLEGIQLYDGVDSTSTELAATANAVKTAYDTAASKLSLSGGTVSGALDISNPASTAWLHMIGQPTVIVFKDTDDNRVRLVSNPANYDFGIDCYAQGVHTGSIFSIKPGEITILGKTMANVAPCPRLNAGVGSVYAIEGYDNYNSNVHGSCYTDVTLPNGGSWFVSYIRFYTAAYGNVAAGTWRPYTTIASGGTTISSGGGLIALSGFAWRIA